MFYSDTIEPVYRTQDNELFLIRIRAEPEPDNSESKQFGGAYVNGWADALTLREAEKKVVDAIQEEGWVPVSFEYWKLVCRDCYAPSTHTDEELAKFLPAVEEAYACGISIILHTWPLGEDDEEMEDEDGV